VFNHWGNPNAYYSFNDDITLYTNRLEYGSLEFLIGNITIIYHDKSKQYITITLTIKK
jgi:hypothetical protein